MLARGYAALVSRNDRPAAHNATASLWLEYARLEIHNGSFLNLAS